MENSYEVRSIGYEQAEVRTVGNSRRIEGYGVVFNQESKPIEGRFNEIVLPDAIDEDLLNSSDVLALMNHDLGRGVLARSTNGSGSMKLTKDSKGIKYSFEAPHTALGDELVEGIRRGDIRTSSFSFKVDPQDTTIERRSDALPLRTIKKFAVIADMSPVYREAYSTTSVTIRSLDEFDQTQLEEDQKRSEAEAIVEEPTVSVSVEELREESKIDYDKYEQAITKYKQHEDDKTGDAR